MVTRNGRYSNFTPTDNQEIIRDKHIERIKRRLKKRGFIIYDPSTIAKIGCNPQAFRICIDTLMDEGMLIHSELLKVRNRWGELINYTKFIFTDIKDDDE